MRKLLLFFAMLCVSIGAWAQGVVVGDNDAYLSGTTWNQTEKVVRIKMEKPGSLAAAISAYKANADLKDAKVVHIYFTDNNTEGMNQADIDALSTLNVETIDLQDAYFTSSKQTFTFTNSNVKSVILPDGWDKDAVNAAGTALSQSSPNLGSCFSMSPNTFAYKEDGANKLGTSVIAYVAKGNTLSTAILHSYDDAHPCYKFLDGEGISKDNPRVKKLKSLTIMGYPSASDFSDSGDWNDNGHFVPNYDAFEFSNSPNARLDGNEVKTDRKSVFNGVTKYGAVHGCEGLVVLDLRDAVIAEENCNDLTLTWTGAISKLTQQVWIPITPLLKTIPADFLSDGGYGNIREICIPANIENIRTRAFGSSSHNLVHVWTTGTNDDIIYDNGAWITDGNNDSNTNDDVKHFGMSDLDAYDGETNVTFGTYTFSENIKLIESNAFSTGYRVKDVYCLGINAPECHVDAFTSVMYNGFNTYDQTAITDGIIDREAYTNSKKSRMYMTMLHYPRECQTPNVQRYTDPTREYSVATGLRDGRGNNIYFPNQSEFTFAYAQGTSGYVWQAWDDTRTTFGDMEIAGGRGFLDPHSTANQKQANGYWKENTSNKKNDRSFYDVTLDGNNESSLPKPSGLQDYWQTIWEGQNLYPQRQTELVYNEDGSPMMEERQKVDADGNLMYSELPAGSTYVGNYVKYSVDKYYEAENGHYYMPIVNRDWNVNNPPYYNKSTEAVEDPNGNMVWPDLNNKGWTVSLSEWLNWGHTVAEGQADHRIFSYQDVYTIDNTNGQLMVGPGYKEYVEGATDYVSSVNPTLYDKETVYDYREANESDVEPFYTPVMEEVQATKTVNAYDYRGWHQFVLTAYATNRKTPLEPVRSFISDNDWWTICVPYDLKYSDMVMFFGTEAEKNNGKAKIPYLSKLMYVIRDQENGRITLMFSKNLMEYKETMTATDHVHGTINDKDASGKYTDVEIAQNPVILHAGVPYLIKPNMTVEADGKFNRQFDIFANQKADLYQRLKDAAELKGNAQMNLIYKGEYTVPAYVVGESNEKVAESKEIENLDGSKITYQSGTIKYFGKDTEYKISDDFTYTFVGTYYNSIMPQYCYFLGWDSKQNKAAFWYNRVAKTDSWDWNNETAIICPNFNTEKAIDPATSLKDPARWILTAGVAGSGKDIECDDFPATGGAKAYMMDFGAVNYFEGETTGVAEVTTKAAEKTTVYTADGIYVGNSTKGLAKGLYIVNGKKYIVK